MGLVLWTFCEYTIHRWLFHMCPPANVPILVLLHFILHGQHHKVSNSGLGLAQKETV